MGMTMTQKILAAHAGLESVKPGDLIMADLDLVLGNDITSPVAINVFKNINKETVFDKDKPEDRIRRRCVQSDHEHAFVNVGHRAAAGNACVF